MSPLDYVILAAVLAPAAFAVRWMWKRRGTCSGCCKHCSHCKEGCRHADAP